VSTLKSSAENLTLNADGSGNDIIFQSNGSNVATLDQAGTLTATTFTGAATDSTKLPLAGGAMTGAITATGDFTIDVGADISLDCGGGILKFKEAGTEIARLQASSSDFVIKSMVSDKDIIFQGNDGGSAIEAMRIDMSNDGMVYIGKTISGSGADGVQLEGVGTIFACRDAGPAAILQRNGGTGEIIRFVDSNVTVGTISTNGSNTAYNTSSDYRLKENVDYTWDATTRLKQLKPARFNFIADDTNTLMDGFIAHEVSSIVPEAISGEKDAMKDEEYEVTPAVLDDDGEVVTETSPRDPSLYEEGI